MKKLLATLGFVLLSSTVQAQEFADEPQKRFYASYRNLLEISDLLGVNRLVERDTRTGEAVLHILGYRYQYQGKEEVLDEMRPLAAALDKRAGGKVYSKRVEYLKTLDGEGFKKRDAAHEILRKGNGAYDEGRQKKEQALYRAALSYFDEALPLLEAVADIEWVSECRFKLGHCHELLGEYYEAVIAYDKAMDEWVASGRPKVEQNYAYMADKRRELIDKGYDPEQPAPTGGVGEGAGKANTITSYAEGSEWATHSTTYKKMRKFLDYPSFSPFCSESILYWRQFGYRVDCDQEFLAHHNKCRPFEHELKIGRDGSKGLLDIDGDDTGDVEIKVIDQKPTNNEIANGRGRKAEKYAVWMATGGQNLTWLGQQVNYQELGFYRVGCYRETKLNGEKLLIIDDNCSGVIGDALDQRDGVLRGFPEYTDLDSMVVGKDKRARPFSEIVRVGDKWLRIKPSDGKGREFKSREMVLETGFVQVDWAGPKPPGSLVIGEVRDLRGAYFDVAGKKAVEVPVGRYQIVVGKIETGKKLATQQAWIFKGRSSGFQVEAGETTTLEMGGPYTFDFKTEDRPREFAVLGKSILIYDRMQVLIGRVAPTIIFPEVTITGSSKAVRGKEMKMISTMEFNKEQFRAWYPADFVVPKGANAECKAQLSLKKDKFLGGPFSSEWQ